MRLLAAAALIALFTLPAHSQQNQNKAWGGNPQADAQAQERKERNKDIEQAYEQVRKSTSRQTTNASDPWQMVRPSNSSPKQ
jgi:hypothetical protein